MKRSGLFLLTILLSFSAIKSVAQDLRAEFALAKFRSPDDGPYLETYLRIKGSSVLLNAEEENAFSEVLITYKVTKAGNTIFEDAYKVRGPEVKTGTAPMDFIDQQRFSLKGGKHELVMTIKDINNPNGRQAKIRQEVVVEQKLLKVFMSDIQLIDTYSKTVEKNVLSKAGYDMVPYTSNYYPETRNELTFYCEVYNTLRKIGAETEFLVDMYIENADDGKIVRNLRKYFKRSGALVVPVLHTFPLDAIESGNYNLVVESRDKKNELLDRKKMFIQRSNSIEIEDYVSTANLTERETELDRTFVGKYNRPEELEEYIRCLHPISNQEEIFYVNRRTNFNDPNMMKQFLFNFWMKRNPDNPEKAWLDYWKEVEKVNASYTSNLNKGYDTDRGRVYLQYGPPNTIAPQLFEPNTYPYEIWHYYQLEDHLNAPQSNVKFIFANTEIGSKEFDLIHSDAKNEVNNRRWHHDLHKRSSMSTDLDQEESGGHYGGKSKDLFENPY